MSKENLDVLIVEDDLSLCEALSDTLELAGLRVRTAGDGQSALECLAGHHFRLVVSDVQMQPMDGLTLLERIRAAHVDLPVLLMTAYGTIEKAVQAMQRGASNYLVKPFAAATLVEQVQRHLAPRAPAHGERVVEDPAMKKLFAMAAKVAHGDATVLIQGESGTGKEVLARYIHGSSPRHAGPFVAINCAAIPENMLEAELFGYEKGAYTGATQSVPGRFEMAQGGTLLLDEISEMDLNLQAKLLRVLQEREVERLGGRRTIRLDVRVLATTNRSLREQVARGDFREDLYYRLSVFPLRIPPLRERPGDVLALAQALLERHWNSGKAVPQLSADAVAQLKAYRWPGNVRELDNVIQRALILQSGGSIRGEDLVLDDAFVPAIAVENPSPVETPADLLETSRRSVEEKVILDTLREEGGSRKSTADRLGISERTLRYKIARMKESGMAVPG
ncbi:sigma-54 dependent transcriptional regulator [Methylococcus sp. EFPC2]|uniref:sigma-54-dependent transcriptional regulator n=1 Tax=Methylococcus sp. EFPC2 TaxID=2812648 RepID=UPI00196708A2|nr:sigma-54 dependent transcriptional regulator [Methylococcus sp. EFPC2]QSA98544.1 sigma-54-dependent Fis family transcriptional regulator [Methylococcus sp. EFPC2]